MKYKLLKSEKFHLRSGDKKTIHIIPLSSSHEDYAVIYPAIPARRLLKSLANNEVEFRRFRGCSDKAVNEIKQALIDMIQTELTQSASKQATMLIMGIIFIVFGLINLFLPDPIILLDDILILAGGIIMIASAIKKKKIKKVLENMSIDIVKNINDLEVIDDNLSSGIYSSIQAKDEYKIKESGDPIEIDPTLNLQQSDFNYAEYKWYVDYINFEELIQKKQICETDAKNILKGISCIFPIRKIISIEEKIHKRMLEGKKTVKLTQKLNKFKKQVIEKCGFSEDALIVYSEFLKSAQRYFTSKGEKL